MSMESLFIQLKSLSVPGIYMLQDLTQKSGTIYQSSNIARDLIHKLETHPDLNFHLLEIVTDLSYIGKIRRLIKLQYYISYYSKLGYNVINSKSYKFKLQIAVLRDFRTPLNKHVLFHLNIACRGYKTLTVGVFETYRDVEGFISREYKSSFGGDSNSVEDLVFSESQLTREFLKK